MKKKSSLKPVNIYWYSILAYL